jgi:hypothetical protein
VIICCENTNSFADIELQSTGGGFAGLTSFSVFRFKNSKRYTLTIRTAIHFLHFLPHFSLPPQRGRDLDSKTSKQASFITHVVFKTRPEPALGFVKWKSRSAPASSGSSSTALGGADHAECPPPARQRRLITSFAQPRIAVWPHRRRAWWAYMALTWPGMPS